MNLSTGAALARRPRGRPQPAAAPALTRAGLPLSFRFLGVSLLSYLTSSRSRRKEEMVERRKERGREEEREMEGGREREEEEEVERKEDRKRQRAPLL